MYNLYYIYTVKTFFGGKVKKHMKEIVLKHNGIEYTEEDIIQLLDLVFEIVGEEV